MGKPMKRIRTYLLAPLLFFALYSGASAQAQIYEFASLNVDPFAARATWATDYITINSPSVYRLVFTLSERGSGGGYPPGIDILRDQVTPANARSFLIDYVNSLGWETVGDSGGNIYFRRVVTSPLAVQAVKP